MKTRWNEMSLERHPSSRAKSVHWRAAFLVVHGALFALLVSACSDESTAWLIKKTGCVIGPSACGRRNE